MGKEGGPGQSSEAYMYMEEIGEEEDPEKEQPQCWTSTVGPIAKGRGSQQGRNHHKPQML